jgi:CRISPR-associated endonuclease/helicase Cas3
MTWGDARMPGRVGREMSRHGNSPLHILGSRYDPTLTVPLQPWQLFWAKTDRDKRGREDYDPEWTRPLWAHLLDVGHAALLLWERFVPDGVHRQASTSLGMTDEEAGAWLSFWIGLHDLGKAIPSFQFQDEHAQYLKRMQREGFTLRPGPQVRFHHGHATISILSRELTGGNADVPPSFEESLAAFVGFHHGHLTHRASWRKAGFGDALGDEEWAHQQTLLLHAVREAWADRYGLAEPGNRLAPTPDWLLGLAGWATLADWLGSLAEAFPGKGDPNDPGRLAGPAAYLDASRAGATRALSMAGFDLSGTLTDRPFASLFPELASFDPRPVQQALRDLDLPADPTAPTLTIVEAPTGEGKTEAALVLAARQQARTERGGGLYLALPTQATANGLFGRATDFLTRAHTDPVASFRLAYGRSELHIESQSLLTDPAELAALYDEADGSPTETRVRTLRWFTGRKRALLAPYGLGTIDQALLGVLFARHFFLRLFGLAGKTVIVDEVHAYDVYMNALVRQLLPWLRALGAHVILLSATLPTRTRRELLLAWDPRAELPIEPQPEAVGYPAIWTSWEGKVQLRDGEADGLTASRTQHCTLERSDPDPATVALLVARAVEEGAAVSVVCNTVRRAQQVFEAIQCKIGDTLPSDDLVLFHARFVRRERQRIEDYVLRRFGKGRTSGPAVLVGTQVIEQSLDLDVDLMLSDLAPIDLLLQRAGRLHRHDRERPDAHATPRLVWLCPAWGADELPDVTDLSGWGKVYARTILWRTARLLDGRTGWSLPDDYRPLIEAVYDKEGKPDGLSDEAVERWEGAAEKEAENERVSQDNADDRLIPEPHDLDRLLRRGRFALADEDDEEAHSSLKAMTREGDSVEVVVLHQGGGDALFLDPALSLPASLSLPEPKKALPTEFVRGLLNASVRLSQKPIVQHLRKRSEADAPAAWREAATTTSSLLGLHPIVMHDGVWDDAGLAVRWHDTLGLVIETS